MKLLRNKAVEQESLSSPLRMAGRRLEILLRVGRSGSMKATIYRRCGILI